MPGSLKAVDLLRDPRFALHNATTDKNVSEGDAKIGGAAVAVGDEAEFARYLEAFAAATGYAPPPGSFHLFKADVREVSTVKPAGDHLDIEVWKQGRPVRTIERK
ncbi:MAG TPA: hypothetical protein VM942_01555, partial [Acidimicrobiales bacterium]|nr:hypothetical protein [Acidimicrobiales bacterium]